MINDELEDEIVRVRQALAEAIAVEKSIAHKIETAKNDLKTWEHRLEIASSKGEEQLIPQVEQRIIDLKSLETQLEVEALSQKDFTENLRKDLARIEARRFSTTTGSDALAATNATLSTIQRMENKIVTHEAQAELSTDDTERKFAASKAENEIEDELKALKSAANKKEEKNKGKD